MMTSDDTEIQLEAASPSGKSTPYKRPAPTRIARQLPPPRTLIPATNQADWNRGVFKVIGEIKPHNARGIREGIEQLRKYRAELKRDGKEPPEKWVLIAYSDSSTIPGQLVAWLADPDMITAAVSKRKMPDIAKLALTWYPLGPVLGLDLNKLISLGTCHTMVGQEAEGPIRKLYEQKFGVKLFGKPSPSANGADLKHEFAMLLGELRDHDQSTYDRIVAQILRELDLTFSGPGDPQRAARRARLRALFARVPASRCRALYARLTRPGPADPLFQHFHSRLAVRTKDELLGILRARSVNLSSRPAAGAAAGRDR